MSRFASVTLKFFVNAARQTCITTSWLGVRSDLATGTGNALGIFPDSVLAPCDTERYKEKVWDFTLMGARQPLFDHRTIPTHRRTSSKLALAIFAATLMLAGSARSAIAQSAGPQQAATDPLPPALPSSAPPVSNNNQAKSPSGTVCGSII